MEIVVVSTEKQMGVTMVVLGEVGAMLTRFYHSEWSLICENIWKKVKTLKLHLWTLRRFVTGWNRNAVWMVLRQLTGNSRTGKS